MFAGREESYKNGKREFLCVLQGVGGCCCLLRCEDVYERGTRPSKVCMTVLSYRLEYTSTVPTRKSYESAADLRTHTRNRTRTFVRRLYV